MQQTHTHAQTPTATSSHPHSRNILHPTLFSSGRDWGRAIIAIPIFFVMTDLGALRVHATGFGSLQTGAHGVGAVKMERELSGGLEKTRRVVRKE